MERRNVFCGLLSLGLLVWSVIQKFEQADRAERGREDVARDVQGRLED